MVPPDRGQILNRAVWKTRHVVIGRRAAASREQHNSPSYSQLVTTSRIVSSGKQQNAHPPAATNNDEYCISIFKSRDDSEPYQTWPISCVSDCSVQQIAHRKQGPVLPTLIVQLVDRERKRRSSRAGFMPTQKEGPPSLWFRMPPDDHSPGLHNWERFIKALRGSMSPDDSPITPTSSTQNFSPRPRDNAEYFSRPGSDHQNRSLHHKSSTATYSTGVRERPVTFSSESPSLRSKRSDVSSPSSNYPVQQIAYGVPGQHYTTVLPTDLPSPVNTTGEFNQVNWNGAPGRESLGSPHQGRGSISSNAQPSSIVESSSPPGPRETILDRAFQMQRLQGAEGGATLEERLSSVARFDALMREADEKRKQKQAAARAEQAALRSAFEADDSSQSDQTQEDTDSDDGDFSDRQDQYTPPLIPPSAHRALQYITGRPEPTESSTSPRPGLARSPLSFHADAAPLAQVPPARPHTAHEKVRRTPAQRSQSTQYLPSSFSADIPGRVPEETTPRQSSSSTKRRTLVGGVANEAARSISIHRPSPAPR